MIRPYGWNVCIPPVGDWRSAQSLALLQPDRWLNWWHNDYSFAVPGYTPMVWRTVDVPAVQERMRAHPAETWLLFNEPERPEQANLLPTVAVAETHTFLNAGWEVGAEFNWCGPNVTINTSDHPGSPWWREYMRQLRLGGINRPSVYGIHLYNSTSRAHVRLMLERLETSRGPGGWLGDDTPVVVTEFCATNEPLAAQIEVMDEVHAMLLEGRIKGAYWYMAWSTSTGNGNEWPNCRLCEVDPDRPFTMRLTELGKHWMELKAP